MDLTHVLVLNADGNPLSLLPFSVIKWQTAVRLCFLDKVKPIEYYENWDIHSPSTTLRVPSIVMTTEFVKYNRIVKYNRDNIYLRDNHTCQLCNVKFRASELTLDHVIPKSKGGKSNWTNIVAACKRCNENKGNDETIRPKRIPTKPSYYEMIGKLQLSNLTIRDPSWLTYISWPEDKIILLPPKQNIKI